MNKAEFEAVVDEAISRLPDWVHEALNNIEILVVDTPGEVIDDADNHLLGLYTGVPLTERDSNHVGNLPDVIYIFRLPHLAMGLPKAELKREIARTTWHEIAHFFGLDDAHLGEIGWG
ncbi:MAG: metallopeptidase family protein [Halieaceae bacterium]|nr:metallopeptidase family protein [Halieaceae bacterium]